MSRTAGCVIPKPILVLAMFATGCLLTEKLRIMYDQCNRDNHSFTTSLYFNETQRNIANHPVSHSRPGLKLFIHRAFLDSRFSKRIVRIYGMEERDGTGYDFKCRWNIIDESTGEEFSQEVNAKRYWIDTSWPEWSIYFACEYDCSIPSGVDLKTITLRSADGKFSFDLKIEQYNPHSARKDLAICVQPTSGYKATSRTIEWFETLKAIGYTDVIMYDVDINGPGRHVMDYYVAHGFVTVVKFPYLMSVIQMIDHTTKDLTPHQRYGLYEQMYLLALHDCVHRFGARFRYVSFLDMDEIIIPTLDESIMSMLHRAESANPHAGAFLLMTSWHWEDPIRDDQIMSDNKEYKNTKIVNDNKETQHQNKVELYMQQYSQGTEPVDEQPKSIMSTDRVITMNLNEILDVAQKDYHSITLPYKTFGAVHHFSGRCGSRFDFLQCDAMIKTVTKSPISRYLTQVQQNSDKVMQHLQLL